jgi:hypothetical protein
VGPAQDDKIAQADDRTSTTWHLQRCQLYLFLIALSVLIVFFVIWLCETLPTDVLASQDPVVWISFATLASFCLVMVSKTITLGEDNPGTVAK